MRALSGSADAPWADAPCPDDAVEVVVARLARESDADRAAIGWLSDVERRRANRFVFDGDRRRFISVHAELRKLLATRLGVRPESVAFVYGAWGKPALAPRFADSQLRFNLSHCDNVAVYAFSRGREIGIDVEAIRTIPNVDRIAARYFSSREYETYRNLDPDERPIGFFNCWTRKEAFVKALGDGLCHPLDRFDVSLAPCDPPRILRLDTTPGDDCGWRLKSFCPAPGFVGALVIAERMEPVRSSVGLVIGGPHGPDSGRSRAGAVPA